MPIYLTDKSSYSIIKLPSESNNKLQFLTFAGPGSAETVCNQTQSTFVFVRPSHPDIVSRELSEECSSHRMPRALRWLGDEAFGNLLSCCEVQHTKGKDENSPVLEVITVVLRLCTVGCDDGLGQELDCATMVTNQCLRGRCYAHFSKYITIHGYHCN